MAQLLTADLVFGLLGGLGLFLFGMKIMSEGLQKVAGNRMRQILAALTNNRVVGTLVGLGVTAIIQSSSATTVMVVGFVNAGLMSLVQAIGVVLGANIGTTVTAQLIAFKISALALPAIGLGAGLKLFAPKGKSLYIGEVILGFGLLFFGMTTMKIAFGPIKSSEEFRQIFMMVGNHHLLGVAIGAALTMIIQSSSATIGITLALATSGLLSFEASVALILGENIGTTITANLAAIGTNLAARRTAFAHFLFNFLGVAYMLLLFPVFLNVVSAFTAGNPDLIIQTQEQAAQFGMAIGDKPHIARHIANTHTLFNIINTLVFLPIVGVLAKLSTLCIRGREREDAHHLKYLDNRVLNTPPIAMGQVKAETLRMAGICQDMFRQTCTYIESGGEALREELDKQENLVDLLQKEITDFLVVLSQQSVDEETSIEINSLLHIVNDLERVADHCENLWHRADRLTRDQTPLSDTARGELEQLTTVVREFLTLVVGGLTRDDRTIFPDAERLENAVDSLERSLRREHVRRLNTGECAVNSGLVFIDMLHNLEKIGDHLHNVAEELCGEK